MSGLCGDFDLSGAGSARVLADLRLDNRRELAGRLRDDGIPIREDPGDLELLLAAWRRWGEECPRHLLGDFAFVLWDAGKRKLFAACDPVGVKPLHYARVGSLVCIGSEAQQVLRHPAVPCRLDEAGVADYLLDGDADPGRTLFQGVRRLLPGHRLVATLGGERIERCWSLDPAARTLYRRDEDYADHFLELFRRAVDDRLRNEGAAGVLMSGGLDSCSVAAVASRRCRLFSVSFVFDRLRECDERPFIQAAADGLGLERETIPAERFPVLDPEACRPSLEGPSLAWDGCFQEALRRARGRGARVLLTGHGGDDLMTGSHLVHADHLRRGDPRAVLEVARHALAQGRGGGRALYRYLVQPLLPPPADRALRRLLGRAPGAELPDWIDPGFARRTGLTGRPHPPRPRRFAEAAREALYDHFQQTPWDRAAHWYSRHANPFGIEVRHPFLDRRLLELLVSIPPDRLFRVGTSKPLLRQAMAGLLPETVRLRKDKTMLGSFLDPAAGIERRPRIERLLAAPLAAELGIFDAGRLRAAWRRNQEGTLGGLSGPLWHSFSLEAWLREHGTALGLVPPAAAQPAA